MKKANRLRQQVIDEEGDKDADKEGGDEEVNGCAKCRWLAGGCNACRNLPDMLKKAAENLKEVEATARKELGAKIAADEAAEELADEEPADEAAEEPADEAAEEPESVAEEPESEVAIARASFVGKTVIVNKGARVKKMKSKNLRRKEAKRAAKEAEKRAAKEAEKPAAVEKPKTGIAYVSVQKSLDDAMELPLCKYCGCRCVEGKFRALSKRSKDFKCNQCNSKIVLVHRATGVTWPPKFVQAMVPEEQHKLMIELRSKYGKALKEYVDEKVRVSNGHGKITSADVEHLPLKVWAKRGFSKSRIKKFCNGKVYNDLLGWTYGISISRESEFRKEEKTRIQDTGGQQGLVAAAAPANPTKKFSGEEREDLKRKLDEERAKARELKKEEVETNKVRKQQVQLASRWMKRIVKLSLGFKQIAVSKFVRNLGDKAKEMMETHSSAIQGFENSVVEQNLSRHGSS